MSPDNAQHGRTLGDFELTHKLGSGGMGEVWHARHRELGVDAAVKLMGSRDTRVRDALRAEIRAAARLDHPRIIRVFDHGVITEAEARRFPGTLIPDSAYLVMELADRGSLKARAIHTYDDLRHTLLALLDALAHAHARGVIHRDLKPSNVLFDRDDQLKLSDFGLAHALDSAHARGLVARHIAGTPEFMAPEQVEGRWRDEGPWTDLYALGCLAYLLASGRCPFDGDDTQAILRSHITESAPPLRAHFPLPAEFQGWLSRMLAKRPETRFRRAADAARALIELPDNTGELLAPDADPHLDDYPVISASIGTDQSISYIDLDLHDTDEHRALSDAPRGADDLEPARVRVPMPPTWRREASEPLAMPLIGAGLGLYGLRPIPMVGREDARDALWDGLREVWEDHSARLVLVHGPEGTGKSRLVEWMAERSHELGLVTVLRANHSPIPGRFESLPRMLANHLRCVGLTRAEVHARVRTLLERRRFGGELDYEARALTESILPAEQSDPFVGHSSRSINTTLAELREQFEESAARGPAPVRFASPTERYVVIRRLLERLAFERPVLLWFDDAHWGVDALGLTRHLLEHAADLPVLIVATVQDHDLLEHPDAARQIDALAEHPLTRRLVLQPMRPDEHARLVEQLLRLEPRVAQQVVQRTQGNPLFAVQLVGDWIQRGVLEVGARGFQLAAGERAELPDDLHDIWRRRIERLVERFPGPDALVALELAAALGHEVDEREWHDVCRIAAVEVPPELLDRLEGRGLAARHANSDAWSFSHEMLRESLERIALERRRWAAHHLTCVDMLAPRQADPHVKVRLGRHLLLAGKLAEALQPLSSAVDDFLSEGDARRAHVIARNLEDALQRYGLPEDDARWGEAWLQQARILLGEARADAAETLLVRVDDAIARFGWFELLPRSCLLRGDVAVARGQLAEALTLYQTALGHISATHAAGALIEGRALHALGRAFLAQDQYGWAIERFKEAVAIFEGHDAHLDLGDCLSDLVSACWKMGREGWASAYMHRALKAFERASNRRGVARCFNNLGEAARARRDFDTAHKRYLKALDAASDAGDDALALRIRCNHALLLLEREDVVGLDEALARLSDAAERLSEPRAQAIYHALRLAIEPDHRAWHHHYQLLIRLITEERLQDPDLARACEIGGLQLEARDDRRAPHALRLAFAQFQGLGDEEGVTRLQHHW